MGGKKKLKYLIIGAGPTGLSAAHRLQESGESDLLVVERGDRPGGLSASFRDEAGFTWDLGGHVVHSHYPEFDELLEELIPPDGWIEHRREAWIHFPNYRVPYPFQLHLDWLPEGERKRCREGLAAARKLSGKEPDNFRDWILSRFGEGIAEIFLAPYNRKQWSYPLEEIGVQWLDDRVALPPEEDPSEESPRRPWGPNASFRFPGRGGTGAIWEKLADRLGEGVIRYGCEIVRVDPRRREATGKDGTVFSYETLLSTMPLTELLRSSRLSPAGEEEIARSLHATPTAVIGLGLSGPRPEMLDDVTWMYFPDPETHVYRLTNFSRYSPANVPDPERNWSLIFELSSLPSEFDAESSIEATVRDARRYGLLVDGTRIVSRRLFYLPYSYPVPTRERDGLRRKLLDELTGYDIYSRGRFGAWLYEVGNMDHCARQGAEWADHVLTGAEEITVNDPRRVNQR